MAGPLMAEAREPTVYWVSLTVATAIVRNGMWNCVPRVLMIVPISREQKSPCAMAPSASIPYLFREISISFRFRNALNFSILKLSPYPDPFPVRSVLICKRSRLLSQVPRGWKYAADILPHTVRILYIHLHAFCHDWLPASLPDALRRLYFRTMSDNSLL